MRTIILVIMLIASFSVFASDIVDIDFFDARGNRYRTTSLLTDLKNNYSQEFLSVKVLLIETPSLDSGEFLKQDRALKLMGHEEFPILFVVASIKQEYKHGYHTSRQVAKELAGESARFRIRLLTSTGLVLEESTEPLAVQQLKRWFRK